MEKGATISPADWLGDLRKFIVAAQSAGELSIVDGADPHLEVGAIYELSQEKLYPPVLLFQNMQGCNPAFRILSNVRYAHFVVGDLTLERLKEYRKRPKENKNPIAPRVVETGPLFENVKQGRDVNVLDFPQPKWHAQDGGAYIGTECLVITKDPDSDWINIGTYRVMVQDERTLSVFIEPGKQGDLIRRKYWDKGLPCPMAVSVGQAPILGAVAATFLPLGQSEYAEAGGRIGRALDVVKGSITGLLLPADAELVFEGYMPPPEIESRIEGPFGEWPGYYTAHGPQPVLRVEAIYHRNDAIIVGQPPAKPNYPGRQVRIPSLAALWDALEAAGVPEVRGVWNLQGGGWRLIQVISIKQLHPGHAKMAGLVAAGWGNSYMTRMIVVVDEDIDITDPAEVMWAMSTRWDPRAQTDIIDGCWTGFIDPCLPPEKRASGDITMSRIVIYAVRPFHWKEQFPEVNIVDRDYAASIRQKWSEKLPFLAKPRLG
jgi:4-hydroxy-3-polyprenylbenzoate decarboxylase